MRPTRLLAWLVRHPNPAANPQQHQQSLLLQKLKLKNSNLDSLQVRRKSKTPLLPADLNLAGLTRVELLEEGLEDLNSEPPLTLRLKQLEDFNLEHPRILEVNQLEDLSSGHPRIQRVNQLEDFNSEHPRILKTNQMEDFNLGHPRILRVKKMEDFNSEHPLILRVEDFNLWRLLQTPSLKLNLCPSKILPWQPPKLLQSPRKVNISPV